jgi:hypothetical protein
VSIDNVVYAFLDDYQADVDARKAKQNVPGTNFVRYREAGKAAHDPRLDPHNFQLSGILDDYLETLPLARRSSFEAFVFGRKLWSLDHSDANGRCASLLASVAVLTISNCRPEPYRHLEVT